ncbi:[F-actin]-monooxygenase mical3 [Kappamyces sp. JEL0680]|nr:[F-actin]-monooxygenase mical3 [Kappamyces sp. JEL0680]
MTTCMVSSLAVLFQSFLDAKTPQLLEPVYRELRQSIGITNDPGARVSPSNGLSFYYAVRATFLPALLYSQKTLFAKLDQKIASYESIRAATPSAMVVSGAGPCGLRAAVDAALLGHSVVLLELRSECSRHNILNTWQQTVTDLLDLGLKVLVPSFKLHGQLHLGTNDLQMALIKAEARIHIKRPVETVSELALRPSDFDDDSVEKKNLVDYVEPPLSERGAIATSLDAIPPSATLIPFDSIIVAEGQSSRLIRHLGFQRHLQRFANAIGIVVNLDFSQDKNGPERKLEEVHVFRMSAFWKQSVLGVLSQKGIDLENLEYKRGPGNHFIASTSSLKTLEAVGVIRGIRATVGETLSSDNVDIAKLYEMGREIASSLGIPSSSPFCSKNGVQVFDFSSRGLCSESFKWIHSSGGATGLVLPAGDALQNPYWPQGLGVNRGFHTALNAIYIAHLWGCRKEREWIEEEARDAYLTIRYFNSSVNATGWMPDPVSRMSQLYLYRHREDLENKDLLASTIPQRIRELLGLRFLTLQERLDLAKTKDKSLHSK